MEGACSLHSKPPGSHRTPFAREPAAPRALQEGAAAATKLGATLLPRVPPPTPALFSERASIPGHQAPVYSGLKIAILKEAPPPPPSKLSWGTSSWGSGSGHGRTRAPSACSWPQVHVCLGNDTGRSPGQPWSWPSVAHDGGAWAPPPVRGPLWTQDTSQMALLPGCYRQGAGEHSSRDHRMTGDS